MKTTQEIKAILKVIEDVLCEGITTGEEVDSTANRIYNVTVVPRDRLIKSLQSTIEDKDKKIKELTGEGFEQWCCSDSLSNEVKDLEQQLEDKDKEIKEAKDCISELVDLMDDVEKGEYKPDSFTTQPAKLFLSNNKQ